MGFLRWLPSSLLFICNLASACTAFGIITSDGIILGKNRDYFYAPQQFTLIQPEKQFNQWHGNPYHHQNKFYALISNNDVKFGINEFGLAAIEEDPPNTRPYLGYSEGKVLYSLLQNFATVKEIIPYIEPIFSTAAPNYYQIADDKSILTVEVAYSEHNNDPKRQFTYSIINKVGDSFTHTNTYLSPEFAALNKTAKNQDSIHGSNQRLQRINELIQSNKQNYANAFEWYLDTTSNVGSPTDKNFCLNTSIFRSNTKDLKVIDNNTTSNKIYGTVSSFMVRHENNNTWVYVRILDRLKTLPNGDQKITFKELKISLADLFKIKNNRPIFKKTYFYRKAPLNGICQ